MIETDKMLETAFDAHLLLDEMGDVHQYNENLKSFIEVNIKDLMCRNSYF
jgi:hypothetical protein